MAIRVGSQNVEGGRHTNKGIKIGEGPGPKYLPEGIELVKLAPSPYRGMRHPPLFDPGRGHNLPLIPETPLATFTVLEKEDGTVDQEKDVVWCSG